MSFWENKESKVFLNPKTPKEDKKKIIDAIESLDKKNIIWVRSSGTESSSQSIKMVCIKKSSFLKAAQNVSYFFNLQEKDIWLNPLPSFHVGGLSIGARCVVSGCTEVFLNHWDSLLFAEEIKQTKATITSVVPTQVFDLVNAQIKAPKSLRLMIVGGGALREDLYKEACRLGWPLALSYGMTETSALVASSKPCLNSTYEEQSRLTVVPPTKIESSKKGVVIDSTSLFEGWLFIDQQKSHWVSRPQPFVVDDQLLLDQGKLRVLGRTSELVKILGESVNLLSLEKQLGQLIGAEVAILTSPERRRGFSLKLFIEDKSKRVSLEEINSQLMPFEAIDCVVYLERFPRTELGKIIKNQLH